MHPIIRNPVNLIDAAWFVHQRYSWFSERFFFDGRIDHFFMLHLSAPHNDFLSLAVALSYVYDPRFAHILLVL